MPEPGVSEGLLLWGAAPEEGSSMRSEADAGRPWHSAALHCCLQLPFSLLSDAQLISFTGVPAKLAQEALEMTRG